MAESTSEAKTIVRNRDLRVDLLRGVALVIVLVDHVECINGVQYYIRVMPVSLGFSDAAEAFVFLSGYTFGMVNTSRLQRRGCKYVFIRAVKRSAQLWLSYVVVTAALLVLAMCSGSVRGHVVAPGEFLASAGDGVKAILLMSLNIKYPVQSILSMYAAILLPMAALLWLMQFNQWIGIVLSGTVYAVAQVFPEKVFPMWPGSTCWYFNPLAWQFLFAAGMLVGSPSFRFAPSGWKRVVLVALSCVVLLGAFTALRVSENPNMQTVSRWALIDSACLTDKSRLAPFRLFHFLAVAIVVREVVMMLMRERRMSMITRWIVRLGQTSLVTFTFGIILTFASVLITDRFGWRPEVMTMIHLDNILLSVCLATGYLRFRERSELRRRRTCATPRQFDV